MSTSSPSSSANREFPASGDRYEDFLLPTDSFCRPMGNAPRPHLTLHLTDSAPDETARTTRATNNTSHA